MLILWDRQEDRRPPVLARATTDADCGGHAAEYAPRAPRVGECVFVCETTNAGEEEASAGGATVRACERDEVDAEKGMSHRTLNIC